MAYNCCYVSKNGDISRNTKPTKTESGIENLNRPITSKEVESVIKQFPIQKTQKILHSKTTKQKYSLHNGRKFLQTMYWINKKTQTT